MIGVIIILVPSVVIPRENPIEHYPYSMVFIAILSAGISLTSYVPVVLPMAIAHTGEKPNRFSAFDCIHYIHGSYLLSNISICMGF